MNIAIEKIMPHKAPMLVLDKIIEKKDDAAICEVTISSQSIFYHKEIQGIYAWVGIEFMAQTIGAYAGMMHYPGEPELGLILSVRQFTTSKAYFALGETLTVIAEKEFMQDNVGVFNTSILINGETVATARLNTIVPPKDKLEKILRGEKP